MFSIIANSTCSYRLLVLFDHSHKGLMVLCISFYCCVTKYHILSTLMQSKFVIFKFLWVRKLGMGHLTTLCTVLLDGRQGICRAATLSEAPDLLPVSFRSLAEFSLLHCETEVPVFLLALGLWSRSAPKGLSVMGPLTTGQLHSALQPTEICLFDFLCL